MPSFRQTVIKNPPRAVPFLPPRCKDTLPQYAGHAAASLSPSVNKNPASPGKTSDSCDEGGALLNPVVEKLEENRPPHNKS